MSDGVSRSGDFWFPAAGWRSFWTLWVKQTLQHLFESAVKRTGKKKALFQQTGAETSRAVWNSWLGELGLFQPNSSCWAGRCSLSPAERRDKAVAGSQMRTAQLWLLLGSFVPLVWPDLRTIIKTHSSHKVSFPRKIRHSRNGFSNGTV